MLTQEASSHSPPRKKHGVVRCYDDKYLAFGLIRINTGGQPKPQCVVCSQVLANEAIKPAKLLRHLQTNHSQLVNKPLTFFTRKRDELSKKTCLRQATKTNEKALRASCLVVIRVAKSMKPHTIAESVIMPAAIDMCREMCGDAVANKLKSTPVRFE